MILENYFHNQAEVGAYLEAWRQYSEQAYEESKRNPSEVIKRLRRLKKQMTHTSTGG